MRDLALRAQLADRGVFFPNCAILAQDGQVPDGNGGMRYEAANDQLGAFKRDWRLAANANPHLVSADLQSVIAAMDAQPALQTTPNAGVPLLFTSIVDPQVVRIIFAPLRAAEILGGEVQKGTWVDQVGYFPTIESTGQVATYGDYSMNGGVDVNPNWTPRQPYTYQTFKRYGERQLAQWGAAGINYSAELDIARVTAFNQFQNKTYFFGVTGLINYGILNDPSLIAAIAPTTKAAGGTAWTNATAQEIYEDFIKLYTQLVTQMGGNVDMDMTMTVALSTTRAPLLARKTAFNVSVAEMIREAYPNLTIKTAPQYTTGSGELMQLLLPTYDGVQTAYPAYTDKMRAHNLVIEPSAWSQKMSGGTWGVVLRRPIAVAQMIGI